MASENKSVREELATEHTGESINRDNRINRDDLNKKIFSYPYPSCYPC
jgi:hypothetical protein